MNRRLAVARSVEPREAAVPSDPACGAVAPRPQLRRVALVGNPNVGKSVLFGALTGRYATVSNYPGTTVEIARAAARFAPDVEIIDTPGVNSLTPSSEDERVTRDILLAGVDCVIQVGDAKNLARALSVSLQLAEAGLPFVLVLNMMDEAADRGITINTSALSAALGVPVIPTVAVTGHGVSHIASALRAARASSRLVAYPVAVERALERVQRFLPPAAIAPRALALMCLGGDTTLAQSVLKGQPAAARRAIDEACLELRRLPGGRGDCAIGRQRVRSASQLAWQVTQMVIADPVDRPAEAAMPLAVGMAALAGCLLLLGSDFGVIRSAGVWVRAAGWFPLALAAAAVFRSPAMRAALGRWSSRRGTGPVVLLVILYVVYRFVGSFAAGTAVDFFEETVFGQYVNPFATAAVDRVVAWTGATPGSAAGVVRFLRDMLVGPYGAISVGLTYAFAIVFPIVTAFFLAFSILEDSGYLPRLAVIVNRLFRGMGLNGKAVLPMVLGLGCDTMATLTARIMETRKERVLVTLLLALGVPCSAQLGVILGLFGALPAWAPFVWGGVVSGTLFAVGFLAARALPGERGDLILEIPPIRRPQLGNVVIKTVGRLEWYLKEAVPIFVLGTFLLFLLDTAGVLAHIIRLGEPVVAGVLGLPAQAAEAFLVGFFRRDYGSAGIYAMFERGLLTPVQAVVALVTITLFVPCVANFFVIVKEHGARTAVAMSAFIFPFAFAAGGVVNALLRAVGLS